MASGSRTAASLLIGLILAIVATARSKEYIGR
jgi:hypothetical protein